MHYLVFLIFLGHCHCQSSKQIHEETHIINHLVCISGLEQALHAWSHVQFCLLLFNLLLILGTITSEIHIHNLASAVNFAHCSGLRYIYFLEPKTILNTMDSLTYTHYTQYSSIEIGNYLIFHQTCTINKDNKAITFLCSSVSFTFAQQ